jgi:hypothetical protein
VCQSSTTPTNDDFYGCGDGCGAVCEAPVTTSPHSTCRFLFPMIKHPFSLLFVPDLGLVFSASSSYMLPVVVVWRLRYPPSPNRSRRNLKGPALHLLVPLIHFSQRKLLLRHIPLGASSNHRGRLIHDHKFHRCFEISPKLDNSSMMKIVTNAKIASLDHDDEVLCPVWAYVSMAIRTYSDISTKLNNIPLSAILDIVCGSCDKEDLVRPETSVVSGWRC